MGGRSRPETVAKWRLLNRDRLRAYQVQYRTTVDGRPQAKARAAAKRLFLIELRSKPCHDCKLLYPHYVMEFDHTRGKKLHKVTSMTGCSMKRLMAEVEKCDIVCANCHKVRTHQRGQLKQGTGMKTGRKAQKLAAAA